MYAFKGDRLKQARLYRGLTITDLAEKVEVTKQAISQFENNMIEPKAETLMSIIRELHFPKKFFYEEINNLKRGEIFYRSLQSTTKKDQYSSEQSVYFVGKIYSFLTNYIDFPKVNLLERPNNELGVEDLTIAIREFWNIGSEPIPSMLNLLENKGVITTTFRAEGTGIDAYFTTFFDETTKVEKPLIVLGNDSPSAVRRNFNIAHELGHYYYDQGNIDLSSISKDEYRDVENRAHEFAGALLLPKDAFINDIKYDPDSIVTYVNIKKKWNVSIAAMIVRAYKLDVIDNRVYQNLMRNLNRKGWRMIEPYDNEIDRCAPYVLPKAVEMLLEGDVFTKKGFVQALSDYGLSLYPDDVENLLDLDKGTLTESNNNIITLKLK